MVKKMTQRIQEARKTNSLHSFSYIREKPLPGGAKTVTKVICKVTGNSLQELIAVPDVTLLETRRDNVVTKIVPAVLAQTSGYDELTVIFADGSRHITPICKSARGRLDIEIVEDIIIADAARIEELGGDPEILNKPVERFE